LATVKEDDPAVFHLPWLAAAGGTAEAARALTVLARHPRAEVRLQAVRTLAEFPGLQSPRGLFEGALADADPRIQLAGLVALYQCPGALPLAPVVKLACSPDTYLRQTAAELLARRATLAQIAGLVQAQEPAVRLAGVLAAGFRLTIPPSDRPPPPPVRLSFPADNAFFKGKIPYADAVVDLRALGRVGSYTTAEYWKAIEPSPEQDELFGLLLRRLNDPADPVRLQAAYFLSLLRDARSEPAVAEAVLAVQKNRLATAPLREVRQVWATGPFDEKDRGFKQAHPPEQAVIDLAAHYATSRGPIIWQEVQSKGGRFHLDQGARPAGAVSSYVFFRLQSAARQPVLLRVGSAEGVKVWHNGQPVCESRAEPAAPSEEAVLLDAQPGSNDLLVRVRREKGVGTLHLHFRAREEAAATMPERLGFATLAQRLREASGPGQEAAIGPDFLQVDWQHDSRRGNAEQGRKLFGSLGCVKCHAITADQKGGGGPSLTEAGRRFTVPYLVESILLPSKQVADVFRSTTVVTTGGRQVAGLVVHETAEQVELLLPDTTQQAIAKRDIESRTVTNVSPMPAGLVKTPAELRDLLAYLLSDNPAPP
jgi:putative heme-binding domain-containing protein